MTFHTTAWQSFLSELGIDLTETQVEQQTHGTAEESIARICGGNLSDLEIQALKNRKEALYRKLYAPHIQAIAGLDNFLHSAQQIDIPIALGTSACPANIDLVLEGLSIESYFSACVSGDDVTRGKPDPETYLMAANRLGVSPESCIVFEDTVSGIDAARNAGMNAIALATTFQASVFESLEGVRQIIRNYTELEPHLLLQQREQPTT